MTEAVVVARHPTQAMVRQSTGAVICAHTSRRQPVITGDRVTLAGGEHDWRIDTVAPRATVFARRMPNGDTRELAANFAVLAVVEAAVPQVDWALVDACIALAHACQMRPVVVINKVDLSQAADDRYTPYTDMGYTLLRCCAHEPATVTELQALCASMPVLLYGKSGVGKSTLVRAITGEQHVRVGQLMRDGGGRHTTTEVVLYPYYNGAIGDTPGIGRGRLHVFSADELHAGFVDIAAFAGQCRFRNCRHTAGTDGCAVLVAVDRGAVAPHRWRHFCALMRATD